MAEREGRGVWRPEAEAEEGAGAVERRFLGSAPTAPATPGRVVVRVAVAGAAVADGLAAVVREVAVAPGAGVAVFRAAAVAEAVLTTLGLLGELAAPGATEVRREAAVAVEEREDRFFSSSETEGWER